MLSAVAGEPVARVPADKADWRRLRPNLVVDVPGTGRSWTSGWARRHVLTSHAYRDAVEADEADGRRHHLDAVPFFLLGGTGRVTSARTVDDSERTLRRVLDR